ncbi:hypothetical protein DRN97_04185 [Methanosarcinales archaeon]|mgnify:CR=1 FL=1|nr:MAG: hypothetical protein DRN97_04185 [Methanosarcinales archaeon]
MLEFLHVLSIISYLLFIEFLVFIVIPILIIAAIKTFVIDYFKKRKKVKIMKKRMKELPPYIY